jgi:outer membrane protein TolC
VREVRHLPLSKPGVQRWLGRMGLAVAFVLLAAPAQAGELSRAEVIRLALAEHPDTRTSALRADAARAGVEGEGGVAPLMVEAGTAPASLVMRPGVELSVGWALPLWRMQELARSGASRRADMADAADRMTRAELAAFTSIAVDDTLLARKRLEVLAHHETTMASVRDSIARRVAAGLAPAGAEAMARMAVLEVEEQRLVAQRDLAIAEAALTALAGVPASSLSREIAPLHAHPTPEVEPGAPVLDMARADLAMRTDMEAMARRAALPMISPMVSVSTMWDDPMHWAMVGVTVDIPLDGKAIEARARGAAAERAAAEAAVDSAGRRLARERADAFAMWQMADKMETLMRSRGKPLSVERARLARTAWESNQGPVSDWLDAEKEVFEADWKIADAQAERSRAIAMLAMSAGLTEPLLEVSP